MEIIGEVMRSAGAGLIFAGTAFVLWLAAAAVVLFSPAPKKRFGAADAVLAGATAVLVAVLFVASGDAGAGAPAPVAEAAVAAPAAAGSGSCVSVAEGMSAAKVKSLAGEPARVMSEEHLRGPGAEAWVYTSARCVVHLLDGVVASVD
jgi:hypothetical protein